jgi:RNA polymerase sigma factor (sigma-70 family)
VSGHFPDTSWSLLRRLRDVSDEERRPHLERLIQLYWMPVHAMIRHSWARNDEDARDLTQQFFLAALLEGDFVRRFAADRGSFRAFLRGTVTNFMSNAVRGERAAKRGGDATVLSLEASGPDLLDASEVQGLTAEEIFDAAWTRLCFRRALELLRAALANQGKQAHWRLFEAYDLSPHAGGELSYRELGESVGMTPDRVKHALVETRATLRDIVTDIVRGYVDGPDELRQEVKALLGS